MKKTVFAALAIMLFVSLCASAQTVTSNALAITLNADIPESISLSPSTFTQVNFAVPPGVTGSPVPGDVVPGFTTTYSLAASRTMTVCAYISGPLTPTISGNTDSISTGNISAQFNLAGGFNSFAAANSACGHTSGQVMNTVSTTTADHSGVLLNAITLQLDGSVALLTPDVYTGTLNIVAQAI